MNATAPGKLIVTGEYAVLDGAPAIVFAVNRRAIARRQVGSPRGSSPFLVAVAAEIAARLGDDADAARRALEIVVDSSGFYATSSGRADLTPTKLGLGSSAAVTVAATALALGTLDTAADREQVQAIATAAHAAAQQVRGARGSGADIAAAVHGGTIVFTAGRVERARWPAAVTVLPFFTGLSADTAQLVAQVGAARAGEPSAIDAALAAIAAASRAAVAALSAPGDLAATAIVGAFALAGAAIDRLAQASGAPLTPPCVVAARVAMARFGGTAKTTGAGGGDVAIAVIPSTADVASATRALVAAGCQPLQLAVDDTGVDLRPGAS